MSNDQPRRMTESRAHRAAHERTIYTDPAAFTEARNAALKADADKRLRAALEAEGVDPDAVARVAARYQKGEL